MLKYHFNTDCKGSPIYACSKVHCGLLRYKPVGRCVSKSTVLLVLTEAVHVLFKISISSKTFSTLFAVWQVGRCESIGAAPHSLSISGRRECPIPLSAVGAFGRSSYGYLCLTYVAKLFHIVCTCWAGRSIGAAAVSAEGGRECPPSAFGAQYIHKLRIPPTGRAPFQLIWHWQNNV